jgi:hypothetical protein
VRARHRSNPVAHLLSTGESSVREGYTFAAGARAVSSMSQIKSGTDLYMSLYPEGSTDGGIRLGNIVPDFAADTTHGKWESFHEWKKGKWAILFSHPADFTPVCTTEIGRLAISYPKLQAMDCASCAAERTTRARRGHWACRWVRRDRTCC